jgi:hypothetical protein
MLKVFGPDALIQAAQDRLGLGDDAFAKALAEDLYQDLRTGLLPRDFALFCDVLATRGPVGPSKDDWVWFLTTVRRLFPGMSALRIAEVIRDAQGTPLAPRAVLSFNAEPLLYSLVSGMVFERFAVRNAAPLAGELTLPFDRVTHLLSNRKADRIPYYFCHGLLPVPDDSGVHPRASSEDKLVFSETAYLQLAGSNYSWQASTFLQVAGSQHMVFVGVSLSDPNMRRWLSWINALRGRELKDLYGRTGTSVQHYWINKIPSSREQLEWIESAVAHLGVRLVWVRSWTEVGLALRALLGL